MPAFEILPLQAIGPVRLGATRMETREVMAAIGFPLEQSRGDLDYFCSAAIQILYDAGEEVLFIGVSESAAFWVMFKGINVFNLPADELFLLMAEADGSGQHEFNSYEYCFPNQILTLWDADEQYDREGGETRPIWSQVGIGSEAYLAAIAAIEAKT
ncbi:hypothetical protein [Pseudomonas xantholysinigenes]|uniref:Uncharacterized protein n=1 Tax=Pseudomonas xantholysinigenes TaxID=2745490 RepID=A0A9E6TUL8_9PSED|nr:hypothetical protein [Pseudomonas xantholysinigenes]QXI36398.1 hypothetical protein HU772_013635 [Pseudomonas xantholysinigenes]